MKAIIPAAGIGKRLRPHTYSLPKALLSVAGKPIISHIIDDVMSLDISSIVFIVGYKGDLIEKYVREKYPKVKMDFVYQEKRMGIGHAIHMTREVADDGEPLLIILGDTIIKADISRVGESKINLLGVKEVEDPRRFGVCKMSNDRIAGLVEKPQDPPSKLAIVGLYYITDSAVLFQSIQELIDKDIRTHGEYQITDALQMMIEKGSKFQPLMIDEWFDCGKPEALLETNRELLKEASAPPRIEGSIIIPPVSIDPSAEIINSIIGPDVSIGADSVVKNSIIRNSVLDGGVIVTDSLLEKSLLGARSVISGRFHALNIGDSSEITIT